MRLFVRGRYAEAVRVFRRYVWKTRPLPKQRSAFALLRVTGSRDANRHHRRILPVDDPTLFRRDRRIDWDEPEGQGRAAISWKHSAQGGVRWRCACCSWSPMATRTRISPGAWPSPRKRWRAKCETSCRSWVPTTGRKRPCSASRHHYV